jgi:hypothetical protein
VLKPIVGRGCGSERTRNFQHLAAGYGFEADGILTIVGFENIAVPGGVVA